MRCRGAGKVQEQLQPDAAAFLLKNSINNEAYKEYELDEQ